MLQIGKMYLVKEYFWFLFPTKELARTPAAKASRAMRATRARAGMDAKWLSQEFKCNVGVVEPNTCVVLLEVDNGYFKLLDSNGNIGWIICWNVSKNFELVKDLC
jgi:hypothetical protein